MRFGQLWAERERPSKTVDRLARAICTHEHFAKVHKIFRALGPELSRPLEAADRPCPLSLPPQCVPEVTPSLCVRWIKLHRLPVADNSIVRPALLLQADSEIMMSRRECRLQCYSPTVVCDGFIDFALQL